MNLKPFPAVVYNVGKGAPLQDVLTQPYDKISEALREEYRRRSPFNIVRVDFPQNVPEEGTALGTAQKAVYQQAGALFRRWLQEGILVRLPQPAFYAYHQTFIDLAGRKRTRRGFVSLFELGDENSHVYAHEQTFPAPILDRCRLVEETHAHFDSIFMLYEDPQQHVLSLLEPWTQAPPLLSVRDDFSVFHEVWAVDEEKTLQDIQETMAGKASYIADGHHRYQASLLYKQQREKKEGIRPLGPYRFRLATFFNTCDEGLVIFPTHRIILKKPLIEMAHVPQALSASFHVHALPLSPGLSTTQEQEIHRILQRQESPSNVVVYLKPLEKWFLLSLKKGIPAASLVEGTHSTAWKALPTVLLHWLILKPLYGIDPEKPVVLKDLDYFRHLYEVERYLGQADFSLYFLKPVEMDSLRQMVQEKETFPQKSTDFYPKLLTGLLNYALE